MFLSYYFLEETSFLYVIDRKYNASLIMKTPAKKMTKTKVQPNNNSSFMFTVMDYVTQWVYEWSQLAAAEQRTMVYNIMLRLKTEL